MNIYTIRKAILKALNEYTRTPITCDDLIELRPNAGLQLADANQIRVQWAELKNFKYIAAIPAFEGKYCEITDKDKEQLSIEFSQDAFIHGPGAIR